MAKSSYKGSVSSVVWLFLLSNQHSQQNASSKVYIKDNTNSMQVEKKSSTGRQLKQLDEWYTQLKSYKDGQMLWILFCLLDFRSFTDGFTYLKIKFSGYLILKNITHQGINVEEIKVPTTKL